MPFLPQLLNNETENRIVLFSTKNCYFLLSNPLFSGYHLVVFVYGHSFTNTIFSLELCNSRLWMELSGRALASYARPWALPQYWKQVNRPIAWFLPEDYLLWEECNGASGFSIGRDVTTTKLVLTNQPCAVWTCLRWTKWVGPVPWRRLRAPGHRAFWEAMQPH